MSHNMPLMANDKAKQLSIAGTMTLTMDTSRNWRHEGDRSHEEYMKTMCSWRNEKSRDVDYG